MCRHENSEFPGGFLVVFDGTKNPPSHFSFIDPLILHEPTARNVTMKIVVRYFLINSRQTTRFLLTIFHGHLMNFFR